MRSSRNAAVALTGAVPDIVSEAKTESERVVIVFTNTNAAGGASCWLSCGQEAAQGVGIQLAAGQSVAFSRDANVMIQQDRWFGYAAAAGTTLAVYEEVDI